MILLIFIILVVVSIILVYLHTRETVIVPVIVAGDVEGEVIAPVKQGLSRLDILFYKGRFYNHKKDFIGIIGGNSMSVRGLKPGDIVIGERYHQEKELNPGDLLIIEIADKASKHCGEYKIREFASYNNKRHLINTVKYCQGVKTNSRPHSIENVRAVVDHFLSA